MTQQTFLEPLVKAAPHNGTPTSREGAEAARPMVAAQCLTVLRYLRTRKDGATNSEISNATGIPLHAVCARRNELVKQGLAFTSGKRKSRANVMNAVVFAK